MKHPESSRVAIDRMLQFTPEDLLRMQGLGIQDSELRVVNRVHYDRVTLEREQALEQVKTLEERCTQLETSKASMLQAAGWPLALILTALCTLLLAR